MGVQGSVYVVYGTRVPAQVNTEKTPDKEPISIGDRLIYDDPVVYDVNGHTVCSDEDFIIGNDIDFVGGFWSYSGIEQSIKSPVLHVRVIGHNTNDRRRASQHFSGEALVGYPVGVESYEYNSSPLPAIDDILSLEPGLQKDIEAELGLKVDKDDLGLHVVWDWTNR